jgi:hypothetical protein
MAAPLSSVTTPVMVPGSCTSAADCDVAGDATHTKTAHALISKKTLRTSRRLLTPSSMMAGLGPT